jgi:hypothetical protein
MAELKTKQNDGDVTQFLNSVEDEKKRADAHTIRALMEEITQESARMWGDSIVGFGHYHYVYDSGREGNWFLVGFSPRKRNLTLYINIMAEFKDYDTLLAQLGKHKTGKSCLYINKLQDVDMDVLKQLITRSVEHMREQYPSA